jgi:hypothetical protein
MISVFFLDIIGCLVYIKHIQFSGRRINFHFQMQGRMGPAQVDSSEKASLDHQVIGSIGPITLMTETDTFSETFYMMNIKIIPDLNLLSTTSRRCMGERDYSSTTSYFDIR